MLGSIRSAAGWISTRVEAGFTFAPRAVVVGHIVREVDQLNRKALSIAGRSVRRWVVYMVGIRNFVVENGGPVYAMGT